MFWPVAVALTVVGPSVALTATVAKLGAASFPERESAGRHLLAAGERAVGPLTLAGQSSDPEVRRRSAELLTLIEANRLRAPTLVSLHTDGLPVGEVIKELARQTRHPVEFGGDASGGKVVTLHQHRVPFWVAVDVLREAGGLQADVQGDGRIVLSPGDASDPFVCYAGPFRITATEIAAGQRRQLSGLPRAGGRPEPEHLVMSFALAAEPHLAVVWVGPPTVRTADDDTGRNLRLATPDERAVYPPGAGYRSPFHQFDISLNRQQRDGKVVRTLRGTLPVAVLVGTTADVTIHNLCKHDSKPVTGRRHTLALNGVSERAGVFTVEVTVSRAAGDTDMDWQSGLPDRLELTDESGAAFRHHDTEANVSDGQSVRCKVRFQPPSRGAKPAHLTLVEWRTVTRDVPFEFKDIPLP